MKQNQNIEIIGKNVILVPYKVEHVLKYHKWMKSEELQLLTGSEPLTLEEEYRMQKTWLEDDDKCTFIILDKRIFEQTNSEIDSMIGDTNLFLSNLDKTQGEKTCQINGNKSQGESQNLMAEAEIMIAEKSARGKQNGFESIVLMLIYGIEELNIKTYQVKINTGNIASIKLFQDKLKFCETSRSEIFNEITYERVVDESWLKSLKSFVQFYVKNK